MTAEPSPEGAPHAGGERAAREATASPLLFLAPAAFFLLVWVVYPTVYTIVRSFFGQNGFDDFVGIDNYKTIFTTAMLRTAIKNNAIWVAVVPAFVTAIGLIFAVLTERIRWSVAFKTAVFMPMAISLFAAGVIWRLMDQKDPNQGTVNAIIGVVYNARAPARLARRTRCPSTTASPARAKQGFVLKTPLQPGGDGAARPDRDPARRGAGGRHAGRRPAAQAGRRSPASSGATSSPGGGTPGKVEPEELGLPGVKVELRDVVREDGRDGDEPGRRRLRVHRRRRAARTAVGINAETFRPPFEGVDWLGPKLITPSIMIAYIWVWAGFSMVVIAAGLAAIPRDTLEAARTDGATEWQVFRRVTVPLLAPVLSVVFITMLINVLKVFDIVLSVAPGSTQDDANVIALQMWRTSFGGVNDFGVGSAIAVFLFLLVIPVLALNVRRFRREV